jgi:hypothetical protein
MRTDDVRLLALHLVEKKKEVEEKKEKGERKKIHRSASCPLLDFFFLFPLPRARKNQGEIFRRGWRGGRRKKKVRVMALDQSARTNYVRTKR